MKIERRLPCFRGVRLMAAFKSFERLLWIAGNLSPKLKTAIYSLRLPPPANGSCSGRAAVRDEKSDHPLRFDS